MPPSFYAQRGLHVEIYDTMTSTGWDEAGADVSFLCERFRNIQGPILELACGTGRVAIPLAEAGYEIHGLDASSAMLSIAEAKRRDLPDIAASRLFLTEGDMREFAFAIQFDGVYVTFRSFQNLLSPEDQEGCLRCIRRHLRPGGILVLNLFDPRYDLLLPGESKVTIPSRIVTHPISGNRVQIEVLGRTNDVLSQCLTETWRFTELGPDNATVIRQEELRWTFRYEMRHLLRFWGFICLKNIPITRTHHRAMGKNRFGLR
jgi:ubiquinone/menaquinone biosynthesis C-methylase UbiE